MPDSTDIAARLRRRNIVLPKAAAPAANYVPFVRSGDLLFVAGQIPILDGEIRFKGKLGADLDVEAGYQAARLCGLNLLSQVAAALDGDWGRLVGAVKLGGFVACTAEFVDHPKVINGASDLMAEALGDLGRHARFAVGASSLPLDVAVEVDGIFRVR